MLWRNGELAQEFLDSLVRMQHGDALFTRPTEPRAFEALFGELARMPGLVHTNVYDTQRRLVWSTNADAIGRDPGANHELDEALSGRLALESDLLEAASFIKPEHAFVINEIRHVFQGLIIDAANDLVEGVVDGTVASRFAMPFGQTQLDVFVVALQRHVHDGGHATPCSGDRASFERVDCSSATERQLHVGVHVNATGHDVFSFGVNHLVGGYTHRVGLTAGIQRHDDLAVNQDVLFVATSRAYDRAIFNQLSSK